jgi:hypothetical protein
LASGSGAKFLNGRSLAVAARGHNLPRTDSPFNLQIFAVFLLQLVFDLAGFKAVNNYLADEVENRQILLRRSIHL